MSYNNLDNYIEGTYNKSNPANQKEEPIKWIYLSIENEKKIGFSSDDEEEVYNDYRFNVDNLCFDITIENKIEFGRVPKQHFDQNNFTETYKYFELIEKFEL